MTSGNKAGSLTIVAAITSNLKVAELPVGVMITSEESGLPYKSVVHLGQIYTGGSITGFSLIRNIFYYLTTINRWTFSNR